MKMTEFRFEFHWNFIPSSLIDNKPALAWSRTGNKSLPEPMQTQFTDAYMRHYGEMS